MLNKNYRLDYIDGIRGWASLIVMMFHLFYETFGSAFPIYRSFYFKFFFDGNLAVYIFFILSGDVLSNVFLNKYNYNLLAKLVLKRYFRLTIPVFVSCLAVFVLMKFDLTFNKEAAEILKQNNWLNQFLSFRENFSKLFHYSFIGVYANHNMQVTYNPFLWTMSFEFIGSFLVFAFLGIYPYLKKPFYVVIFIIILCLILGSVFTLFFVGMLLSMLRKSGYFNKGSNKKITWILILSLCALNFYLRQINHNPSQVTILISSFLVLAFYKNEFFIQFFSNKFSKYLGKISFPLYLIHFSIIVSFTSYAVIFLSQQNLLNTLNSFFIILLSLVISLLFADILSRVEKKYLKFLDGRISVLLKNAYK